MNKRLSLMRYYVCMSFFFFSSRRRHTRFKCDWSSDVCSSDLVARFGSVRVRDLLTVERYSHVQHLVSEVGGQLRDGYDALDVFKACFPAGTVTGAPKVRAMEIIDELEPERRGPYAGAVGYVGWGAASLDTAITIRSAVARPDRVVVQA